jgi:hypothetical protein
MKLKKAYLFQIASFAVKMKRLAQYEKQTVSQRRGKILVVFIMAIYSAINWDAWDL